LAELAWLEEWRALADDFRTALLEAGAGQAIFQGAEGILNI
jgi:hypothetical protein